MNSLKEQYITRHPNYLHELSHLISQEQKMRHIMKQLALESKKFEEGGEKYESRPLKSQSFYDSYNEMAEKHQLKEYVNLKQLIENKKVEPILESFQNKSLYKTIKELN